VALVVSQLGWEVVSVEELVAVLVAGWEEACSEELSPSKSWGSRHLWRRSSTFVEPGTKRSPNSLLLWSSHMLAQNTATATGATARANSEGSML